MPHVRSQPLIASMVVSSLALSTVSIGPALAVANGPPPATEQSQENGPTQGISEEQFQHLYQTLDKLPEDIKNAAPKTYPNYEQRLDEELRKIDPSLSTSAQGSPNGASTYINWVSCGAAVAGAVAQYGIPFGQAISWLKEAVSIYKNEIPPRAHGGSLTESPVPPVTTHYPR